MSKRTKSQKTGSLGFRIVEEKVERSEVWIARDLNEDFGIDIEIEYSEPEVMGKIIKAQVKSHKHVKVKSGYVTEVIKKSFLRYVNECRIPIVLIIVDTEKSTAWYIWLQQWLIDTRNISNIYDETEHKTITVKIDEKESLQSGLKGNLISIAHWENSTQLYIALKDLANLSLRMYDDELSVFLFNYLDKLRGEIKDDYLESLIERIIELGDNIRATHQGNKLSSMLFEYVRKHGNQLNVKHVTRFVSRSGSYSRTGITALGILYDEFPEYAQSLSLPTAFSKLKDQRVEYYCSIRERYLGTKSPAWFDQKNDLSLGKLKVDFSEIGTSIFDKWANRGDSAILDYLIVEE
ncbi:MAG: DUF4365 domain-containing protein [Bacteroidia bacterium]